MIDIWCHMCDTRRLMCNVRSLMFFAQSQTSDIRRLMFVDWCQTPDVICLISDVWCLMSYVWYQTADVLCQASDVFCLVSDVWYQMSDVICLISDVWCLMSRLLSDVWCLMTMSYVICLMSNVRCLMSDIRCHFDTRVLSGTKIKISRVGDFVRSYYQPLGSFFFVVLIMSSLNLSCHYFSLLNFTPIGLELRGRVLSFINYIGMPVPTCLGLESGMSSIL